MSESETNELEILRRRVKELELDAEQPTTRGHKRVIQIIAGKKIYFCKTSEEELIFSENNPGVETETFHIELLNSTAERYLNDPENKKQFAKPVENPTEVIDDVIINAVDDEIIAALGHKELTWRQQAKELGIPLHKEPPGSGMRKKEDVLADIINRITVSTSVS